MVAFASPAPNLVAGDGNSTEKKGASDVFVAEELADSTVLGEDQISPGPRRPRPRSRRHLVLSAFSLADGDVKLVVVAPAAGRLRARAAARLQVASRQRKISAGVARAKPGEAVPLILSLPSRYRRLARSREGIYAMASVSFRGASGSELSGRVQVRFHARSRAGGGG
jgi:hypothetical protein